MRFATVDDLCNLIVLLIELEQHLPSILVGVAATSFHRIPRRRATLRSRLDARR